MKLAVRSTSIFLRRISTTTTSRVMANAGSSAPGRLEDLTYSNTFQQKLPADPNEVNVIRQVEGAAYSRVAPSPTQGQQALLCVSRECADLLHLDYAETEREEFLRAFSGQDTLEGMDPYAMCYGGHQFGNWAGQLGDGRAIVLGEVQVPAPSAPSTAKTSSSHTFSPTHRYELQLKGAGKTPYSRRADGRAVLRSSVREFICSEAMHALGIPTTRALSLIGTGDLVMRDMFYDGNARVEPGAVVCRVAPSFIRFGSFELPASRGDFDLVGKLCRYVSDELYEGKPVAEWYQTLCERTARMVVGWQTVGFVHGVMNTDNMSILGVTIDYGPYGFLEEFDPNFTPNTTDMPGLRYCFKHQPGVAQWNLAQLANALLAAEKLTMEEAQAGLTAYTKTMEMEYPQAMAAKVGVPDADPSLISDLLQIMYDIDMDFTRTFRCLSDVTSSSSSTVGDRDDDADGVPSVLRAEAPLAYAKETEETKAARMALGAWVKKYRAACVASGRSDAERKKSMDSVNPLYIPRNWLAQVAIEAAEKGDYSKIHDLHEVLKRPFTEQEGKGEYAAVAPAAYATKAGVVRLSCSS